MNMKSISLYPFRVDIHQINDKVRIELLLDSPLLLTKDEFEILKKIGEMSEGCFACCGYGGGLDIDTLGEKVLIVALSCPCHQGSYFIKIRFEIPLNQ